jgi:hypothetical protein
MAARLLCKENFLPMRTNSWIAQRFRQASARKSLSAALALGVSAFLLAGCGLFTGPEPTPTATRQMMATVPTFTPAPPAAQAASGAAVQQPTQQQVVQATDTPVPPAPTDTPIPEQTVARFTVKSDLQATAVNVRSGPSTGFPPLGTIARGDRYEISGKNVEGTWYAFVFNGRQGWVYMGLVNVENPQLIALAQNIPPTPVPPPPPTATPVPAAPAPAPADPCAGIGGDGCKFRLREGPKFGHNGGSELKLLLGFVRVLGDGKYEWQGSYFVGLMKDGTQVMPTTDQDWAVRSWLGNPGGGLGPHNYTYNLKRDRLPGGSVNGNYTMWVMDGHGERDSQNIQFTVSGDQGEVWIILSQN